MKNQYRFFCDSEELTSELKHQIFNVLRLKAGNEISVINKKKEYLCKLTNTGYEIIKEITCDREAKIDLTLGLATIKKDKTEYVLQKCTECGVNNFIIFNGDNSVKTFDKISFDKILPRYKKIIRESCEQSLRLKEPNIAFKSLKDINFCDFDKIIITDTQGIKISNSLQDFKGNKILLLIGPEGGFSEKEFNFLKENKGTTVSFGQRILRSETASIVISASIIDYFE